MMGRGGMLAPAAALSQYFETGAALRTMYSSNRLNALLQQERGNRCRPVPTFSLFLCVAHFPLRSA
jgi:hypothetical protein